MLFTELVNSGKHCRLSVIPPKMTNLTAVVALDVRIWLGTITLNVTHSIALSADWLTAMDRFELPAEMVCSAEINQLGFIVVLGLDEHDDAFLPIIVESALEIFTKTGLKGDSSATLLFG